MGVMLLKKRADSGGFKPRLLGNETIDGAKEGAERLKWQGEPEENE